jgi:hypothetical protein
MQSIVMRRSLSLILVFGLMPLAGGPVGQTTQPVESDAQADDSRRPPTGLLTPIPEAGEVPPILGMLDGPSECELRVRAAARKYAQQIKLIRHRYFGQIKVQRVRKEGLSHLVEFTDPASFRPLIEELAREQDDVRLALIAHLANQGDPGQAALAWLAIHDADSAIRHEALNRLTAPASGSVLSVLNSALRSREASVANNAATAASTLNVVEAIPLLIFAQAVANPPTEQVGDLAWIAIETQRTFVSGLVPVTGDASGAFQPIISTVSEGSVLRIQDAVVISYRTEVHTTLVNLTTNDWGQPTAQLGYNIDAWWRWYNQQYLPRKNQQRLEAQLAAQPHHAELNNPAPTSP